jgi:DNA modification methylase
MIAQANCFRIPLPDKSIHCCVTSPPYFGLRKYAGNQGDEPLGLEPTPERHIERTVQWAREVYRVLRDDGVFWLNYGDCYATSQNGRAAVDVVNDDRSFRDKPFNTAEFLPAGNLILMPHRIALALQADGWIVRQDLIWAKSNPMPESVRGWTWQRERSKLGRSKHAAEHNIKGGTEAMLRDASIHQGIGPDWVPEYEYGDDYELRRGSWRHTRGHEYVLMLCKSMKYWSDGEAIRERLALPDAADGSRIFGGNSKHGANLQHGERTTGRAYDTAPSGRNSRSVLHIPTAPYKGAHYATFPPTLIAPLILATCPRWCCPVCGQGWAPVVDKATSGRWHEHKDVEGRGARQRSGGPAPVGQYETGHILGHRPTCDHPHTQAEALPGIVLDLFVGSGTTVMVAKQLLRRGIGFDLSMEYLDLQATLRTGIGSPSNQLDNLPLFAQDEIES